jgi:hypothetical protein
MKKILFVSILLFSFSFFCNAQSKGQMERRIKEESIPKDLSKYTLLVKIPYNTTHWVNKISECMQNHYTVGSFEVIPYKTSIAEFPYNDASKYRYVLLIGNSLNKFEAVGFNNQPIRDSRGMTSPALILSALYMLDRTTGEVAYSGLDAQDLMKILAFYAEKLAGKD